MLGRMAFHPSLPAHEIRSHTVAFRLTSAEYMELLPFFEAFAGSPSNALRWLLSQESTKATMQEAVTTANA